MFSNTVQDILLEIVEFVLDDVSDLQFSLENPLADSRIHLLNAILQMVLCLVPSLPFFYGLRAANRAVS